MSDEIKATNFGCCDRVGGVGGENNWLEWIIIIGVIWWIFGGNNFFGGGCCR